MTILPGWGARWRGLFSDIKGPWGASPPGSGGGGGEEPPSGNGPKGPWGDPPKRRPSGSGRNPATTLDEFLQRSRTRFGGSGGGFGGRPDRSIFLWAALAVAAVLLLFSTMHRISPEERGVVTRFGRYSHTLGPGIGLTLPFPVDSVQKLNVEEIRNIDLGSAAEETLVLTGDQNIIDIAYQVRWNIRDPEKYLYELAQPEDTIKQVAESSMRQIVSQVTLNDAIGNKRGEIEARVREEMQQTLDFYQSGVLIQGVAVKQADPPAAVNEAFKAVTAAQQAAQSDVNQANAYALQLRQLAQGEATSFDKVYAQYKLAPEVTRRRMYYETMERVLRNVDKTIVETPGVTPYLPLSEVKRSVPREPAQ
ncbi:MAG: FtsH protease activity modulator HflK [Sphingomonas sp.]|uniref:FtsH protease activity modulator HflK n=1 Tax=Sphingomonas sp. TaxID=28214 RepID=UPI0018126B3A|nr:FtsH protease activity modulator HflK [Sphingomonas sp.]MBA3666878.1 FtsH protease activity modulator HflK [Sphingomonas sp.]